LLGRGASWRGMRFAATPAVGFPIRTLGGGAVPWAAPGGRANPEKRAGRLLAGFAAGKLCALRKEKDKRQRITLPEVGQDERIFALCGRTVAKGV
jgi:hypothetical protein